MLKVLVIGTFLILELMNFSPSAAFDSFEHRYIADEAFNAIFRANPKDFDLSSRDIHDILGFTPFTAAIPSDISEDPLTYFITRMPVSFGDLAALAGDFVETPTELDSLLYELNDSFYHHHGYPRTHPTFIALRRQWLNACTWIRESKREASKEAGDTLIQDPNSCMRRYLEVENEAIKEHGRSGEIRTLYPRGSQGYGPSRIENLDFEKTESYASLASKNSSHFPIESWEVYRSNHEIALSMAKCYAALTSSTPRIIDGPDGCDVDRSLDSPLYLREHYLRQAFIHEGFAQHFLQDSFSSGHIGTSPATCLYTLFCVPSKGWIRYRHDVYNQIGLNVRILNPPDGFLEDTFKDFDLRASVKAGWTSFGDQHLFTRESAFHRLVVLEVAKESLRDLANALRSLNSCRMCSTTVFPEIASEKLRNSLTDEKVQERDPKFNIFRHLINLPRPSTAQVTEDPNVPSLHYEGWKLLVSYGNAVQGEGQGSERLFTGAPKGLQLEEAVTFDVGYVRSTSPWTPNYIGAGYLYAPGFGASSIYPLSVGYWGNPLTWIGKRVIPGWDSSASPLILGLRLNSGFQILDANTTLNSTSARTVRGQLSLVLDTVITVYDPLAIYLRSELFGFSGGEFHTGIGAANTGLTSFGFVWSFSEIKN